MKNLVDEKRLKYSRKTTPSKIVNQILSRNLSLLNAAFSQYEGGSALFRCVSKRARRASTAVLFGINLIAFPLVLNHRYPLKDGNTALDLRVAVIIPLRYDDDYRGRRL